MLVPTEQIVYRAFSGWESGRKALNDCFFMYQPQSGSGFLVLDVPFTELPASYLSQNKNSKKLLHADFGGVDLEKIHKIVKTPPFS